MIHPKHFAPWVSPAAVEAFASEVLGAVAPEGGVAVLRAHYDASNRRLLDIARAHYPVAIDRQEIGGVAVHVVRPIARASNAGRLICLHGGGFMWGADAGALLEAVPVAASTGMTVVAVDYRLAPEHVFPAAVEDVLAVYRALVDDDPAGGIGIYGCSAGAMLTAQLVARLIADGLPIPSAIAMLHGAGLEFAGDSMMTAGPLTGVSGPASAPHIRDLPYFASAELNDPLVLPGHHPAILAHFPPSLLITGTRDFAASAVTVMHRRLLTAGVDAALIQFDGMGHAHHMVTTLPESRETFAALARFFGRYLG